MNEWFYNIAFSIGDFDITWGNVVTQGLIFLLLTGIYLFIRFRFLPKFFEKEEVEPGERRRIKRLLAFCLALTAIVSLEIGFQIDYTIFSSQNIDIGISNVLITLLLLAFARLLDVVISKYLIHTYYKNRGQRESDISTFGKDNKESTYGKVRQVVYLLALQFIIRTFDINYILYSFEINEKLYTIKISSILSLLLILALARLLNWIFIHLILQRYYKKTKADIGRQYAINRLLAYFIYLIAVMIALEMMGFNLTLVWGGLAALLLGVGLGLQQTFNDLASGLILLFERTVEVGDIVLVEGEVSIVRQIGLRTSLLETRNSTTIIVPNSKLIIESVANWSHTDNIARFQVTVGVAYGSDTELVKNILLEVAKKHPKILENPTPLVRFIDFADSSLNFELHFWSQELFRIEDVKSDLRFEIDRVFRENNVSIPFPQRDVWFKNPLDMDRVR
ncbi:MAG: mechanosensitive ion channel [Saprospiraceae bacterium]|nr:mechanosensitive ion channel [Saprospiraceae bacterium]